MAELTEKLIFEVEKNRVLYDLRDKDYKDINKKSDIWKDIAERVGLENGESASKKWTNLKDAYVQYTRKLKTSSGQGLKGKIAKYKWADQLQFLNDFTMPRRSSSNLDFEEELQEEDPTDIIMSLIDNNVLESTEEEESIAQGNVESASIQEPSVSIKRKHKEEDINTQIMGYLSSKTKKRDLDSKDSLALFFQSTLQTVRTFPPVKQLEVKRKISNIVFSMEEELLGNLNHEF